MKSKFLRCLAALSFVSGLGLSIPAMADGETVSPIPDNGGQIGCRKCTQVGAAIFCFPC